MKSDIDEWTTQFGEQDRPSDLYLALGGVFLEAGISSTYCIRPVRLVVWDVESNPHGMAFRNFTVTIIDELFIVTKNGNRILAEFLLADPQMVDKFRTWLNYASQNIPISWK